MLSQLEKVYIVFSRQDPTIKVYIVILFLSLPYNFMFFYSSLLVTMKTNYNDTYFENYFETKLILKTFIKNTYPFQLFENLEIN